jgi:SPP1 family predicted phage head-tail adaptor
MGSIGSKQNRVTIQRAVQTADSHGGSSTAWSTFVTVWAHERPLSGREAMQAQQVTATLNSVLEIHHRTGLSVKDRVLHGARTLEIEAIVDPTDTRKELHLFVSEAQS